MLARATRSARPALVAAQRSMAYSAKVLDHNKNPRNVGTFDEKDPNVGTGLVGAPVCGDVMKLQVVRIPLCASRPRRSIAAAKSRSGARRPRLYANSAHSCVL